MNRLRNFLFKPIDNSQLVLFRIIFGFLITCEAWGAILTGWVRRAFVEPRMNFPFLDFDFLQPLPGNGMIYYFLIMGVFGVMIMLGFKYRIAAISFAILWSGVYFMQKTHYNNHYYLMMLLSWLFCFLPANQSHSLDVKSKPDSKRNYCFQWHLWIFKGLVFIVYFFSAIAKMYPDWINAIPIKIWFIQKANYPIVGPLLIKSWFQYFVAWGGIAFDLFIVPALLWKRTRKYAFIASLFFHGFNSIIFQVGIFPFMGIAFGLFYFEPETIRRLFFKKKESFSEEQDVEQPNFQNVKTVAFTSFIILMVLLPLRHHYFDGNVTWTEEGHRMSWRMMLRSKGGIVDVQVRRADESYFVNLDDYLTPKQQRAIATRPDMFWSFIQYLKQDLISKGEGDYEGIYAVSRVSLNGRPAQALYDPMVDFSTVEWNQFSENVWVSRQE